jgi:hypothetical protein
MRKLVILGGLLAMLPLASAHAYIGPGAGAGTIAIVLGILSSIVLAFVGILWYPAKRLLKKLKGSQKAATAANAGGSSAAPGDAPRAPSGPGNPR